MSATVKELIKVLETSERRYQELLPLLLKEKNAAFNSEPEKLSVVLSEKEEIMAQLRQLERNRQLILNQMAAAWHIPVEDLRLSTLASRLEGAQSSQIRRLRDSLKGLVQRIKHSNDENRRLIQHCLEIVHSTLGFFQHWVMPTDVYGASGQISLHNKSGNIVSGAI